MQTKTNYKFPDWFKLNIPNFELIKSNLPVRKNVLEIGSFEGRSASWILQNFLEPDGTLICVDTFEGSPEHNNKGDLSTIYDRWHHNTNLARGKKQTCKAYRNKSYDALAQLITEKARFDFIYVDGGHTAPEVLADACMSWDLLNVGGVMLFDDYQWPRPVDEPNPPLKETEKPKLGVNAFASVYAEKLQVVISNYQLAVLKIN